MKTALKFCLFLGILFSVNVALSNDQIDPGKRNMLSFGDNEDQIDQQVKPGGEHNGTVNEFNEKKATTYKQKNVVTKESVNSFSYIILKSLPADFMDEKRQSFFILPFSFSLK